MQGKRTEQENELKRLELQKEFMEVSAKKQFQEANTNKSFGAQIGPVPRDERLVMTQTSKNFDAIEGELMRKVRDLTKRSEELTDDVRTLEEQNVELRSDKNRL